jgi:hypothetical protein
MRFNKEIRLIISIRYGGYGVVLSRSLLSSSPCPNPLLYLLGGWAENPDMEVEELPEAA